MKKRFIPVLGIFLAISIILTGCNGSSEQSLLSDSSQTESQTQTDSADISSSELTSDEESNSETTVAAESYISTSFDNLHPSTPIISLDDIPSYSNFPYAVINNNLPYFTEADYSTRSFEAYSDLDFLNRCGAAYACIGIELMPTEERGSIGSVKPSGWQTVKYDIVDGKYLYNRCHLIGYQLSGENANEKNLITGTRYMNVDGMLPFENMVADFVKETGSHVLYRVTPLFNGDNLLASGVLMEAYSVEDSGSGICFNVFVYNVQPGIIIDYSNGDSTLVSQDVQDDPPEESTTNSEGTTFYVLNTNTHKFHYPSCSSVDQMNPSNRNDYTGSRDYLIAQGYDPCRRCNP